MSGCWMIVPAFHTFQTNYSNISHSTTLIFNTMSNVQQLEKHLATKSYVDGYVVFLFSFPLRRRVPCHACRSQPHSPLLMMIYRFGPCFGRQRLKTPRLCIDDNYFSKLTDLLPVPPSLYRVFPLGPRADALALSLPRPTSRPSRSSSVSDSRLTKLHSSIGSSQPPHLLPSTHTLPDGTSTSSPSPPSLTLCQRALP